MAYDDNFEDMFESIRKLMRSPFDGLFGNDTELFGITDNLEKEFKNKDKNAKKSKKGTPNTKSYAISYKFGTGMDKPEIQIHGDINEDDVNRFLEGIVKNWDQMGISGDQMKMLKPKIEGESDQDKTSNSDGIKTPFMDLQETKDGAIITLEMPGIGDNDVKINFKDYGLEVQGERAHMKYRREITLAFKPTKDAKITTNNGIVTIELKKA